VSGHIMVPGIVDAINLERFRELLRNNGLAVSGTKKELTSRIIQAINGELERSEHTLTVEKLDEFIANEIAHGKNRMLFISSFPEQASQNLKDIEFVKKSLEEANLPTENFNILRTTSLPENTTPVYLNIEQFNNEVTKISLCFAKKDVISGLVDEEGEVIPPRMETDYIWTDIIPDEQKIIIKMRQKSGSNFTNYSRTKEIYDEISTLIRETFSLAPKNLGSVKNIFYNMFKDLTETAEKPFRDKVSPFVQQITDFANDIAEKIGLKSSAYPVDLPHRLVRLLERALIQQDFDQYERYFEGKRGIVTRIYYSDDTGASVNARSSESEEGIAVADIYFDTKESIESRGVLDKIWITWFYRENPNKPLQKIETKFEAYKEYFIIHFLYAYTTKEIQNHVLSNFKHYEEISGR
jgi:hypothetical protein